MNSITEGNCKGNLWGSNVINGNGNGALAAPLRVLPLQKETQFSNDCSAWDTICLIHSTVSLGEVSPNSMEEHCLYTTTSATLPLTLQSRSQLHKHPRISKCKGELFMKQGNFTAFLHLPSFLPALCSASFLPSQGSAILAMDKCPTSTARIGRATEIGVSCTCLGQSLDRVWKLWKPRQLRTSYRED